MERTAYTTTALLVPALLALQIAAASVPLARQAASLSPASNLPTNWTYVGCWSDNQGARTLGGANYGDNSGMNATSCISYCQSKGNVYAGTEYSTRKSQCSQSSNEIGIYCSAAIARYRRGS